MKRYSFSDLREKGLQEQSAVRQRMLAAGSVSPCQTFIDLPDDFNFGSLNGGTSLAADPNGSDAAAADDWPALVRPLKLLAKGGDTGLGDIVQHVIGDENSEAFQKWFKEFLNYEGGGNQKKEYLNGRYPLNPGHVGSPTTNATAAQTLVFNGVLVTREDLIEKFEIVVVGYRWFWQSLERAIDSILKTNKYNFRISVGINSPEPEMLQMIEKYRSRLHRVEISEKNINKVGMQHRLVHLCSAKYIVSFDDDSFAIHKDWQDYLVQRVESYESGTLRYFGDFGEEREAKFKQMTNNTVGIMGLIFYEFLEEPKRAILAKCPWYDPANRLKHEGWNEYYKKDQIWFCAGAFYTFLRKPYIEFNYPGFNYKMAYEDQILSYFYQHHGYRLGDFGGGFEDSGLDNKNRYSAFGNRVIVNAGQRSFDLNAVEEMEHSSEERPWSNYYENGYL
jgi:hypothetical protein